MKCMLRWAGAALLLLAAPADAGVRYPDVEGDKLGSVAYPVGRLDCPNRLGHYGFGSCATGGTGLTTYTVDTTTWVGPSDGGFDRSDCDAAGGDACSFAEAVCRAAQAGGGTVAVNVAGGIRIPNVVSANDGTGSSAFSLRDCPGVTATTPARNITITGAGATGAGAYITNGDFFIDAAYNVILEQMRHRGSADDGTDHSYLGAGFGVLSGDLIVVDHISVEGTQAYASAVNSSFVGNNNAAMNRVSYSNALLGPSTMFNRAHRSPGTDEFVLDENNNPTWGTCSTAGTPCCVDAAVTTGVGGCPGVETCIGADADSCAVDKTTGLCFGGLDGGADLATGGASCDADSDCRGGVCAAYCAGTGTSAGKRAGTVIGNGHEASANWVFARERNLDNPPVHGVCYASANVGRPCTTDAHCGGIGGACVKECPNATDFATGLMEGMHNYGLFTGGNFGHISIGDTLVMGNKWRSPEVSPDAFNSGTLTLNRVTQAEYYRIEAYGGQWQTNIWTEDADGWNRYRHDVLFYRNHHNFTAANRILFSDIIGDFIHANIEWASFNTTQDAAANARYYFKDNLDRFNGVGAEVCEDGIGLACDPTGTDCDSFSTNFGDAGADCTYETGATVNDSKYSGPRNPWTTIPADSATHAAQHTAKLAALGATLPCRDAVDELLVRELTADRAIRINTDRLELGGPQVDMTSCPDSVVNVAPTCGAVDRHFASGSGWVAWTQAVTNADTWPLTLFCYINSAGTVDASVYDRTACADGTVEGAANLTGQPDGSYPISYYADDGEDRTLCTFNLIMP